MQYFEQLKRFITQSRTDNLKNSSYTKQYSDLKVKVSFGQGKQARMPWIAFLGGENTVQRGIYPQYIFVKERNLLILAHGVSERNVPVYSWELENAETVTEYFAKQGFPIKAKSFVYKVYDLNKPLPKKQIESDLNHLLNIYKETLATQFQQSIPKGKGFNYKDFHEQTKHAGLIFSERMVARFVASLCAKPFVICSGLSGSGKTKLAQSFAQWICGSGAQYSIIPVGADWTNREPLLGYPNGLDPEEYVLPDSGALQLMLEALRPENAGKPYFMILDEMNLSHVERYFADFLSIMESKERIRLYSGKVRKANKMEIPQEIGWPENLFIVGTVNIDETTYMFSPKVLDRANVIEFRISRKDLDAYMDSAVSTGSTGSTANSLGAFADAKQKGLGSHLSAEFLKLSGTVLRPKESVKEILGKFFEELQKAGAEFGYRSAAEINRLIGLLEELTEKDTSWDGIAADGNHFMDIAIMQKLLPKLHGSRHKLSKVLPVLGGFCLGKDTSKLKTYLEETDLASFAEDEGIVYKLSLEKICRMYRNAVENGYAGYAEA